MDLKYMIKEMRYYKKVNGLPRAIKKFSLSQTPLKKIVNTPAYNKVYSRAINKKIKNIEPKILQIENTNLCNAKCIMCPHVIMKRKGKIMSQKDFEKILDNSLKNYKIQRLTITGFGEPFMDLKLAEKIKYVNDNYPEIKIDIYTNASLLTDEFAEKLFKTKIDRITFSINGTKRNYKKIMGLNYNSTQKRVLNFLIKNKKNNHHILTNISLMILKENEKDVKKFMDFWKHYADSVRVYAPSDWAGTLKNLNILAKPVFKNKRWPCFALWNNITVDVDGNVIMCCRDFESKVIFGNALKQDIKEIRNSKDYQELLSRHLNHNFSTPICAVCENSFDSSLDWFC